MFDWQEALLILAVAGVGVLHTMVPDHWVPIALLARQRGWSRLETARIAIQAGSGHVATTLLFGLAVWLVGAVAAERFGHLVDLVASLALVVFGLWIAIGSWREINAVTHNTESRHPHGTAHGHSHAGDHGHSRAWDGDRLYLPSRGVAIAERHAHTHRHGRGSVHHHWHDHVEGTTHTLAADAPVHVHRHRTTGRMALLLVIGSSPMVEGIPAFLAASKYGLRLLATMSVVFAVATIATYVVLSVYSASSLQRLNLGPVERYGEVISGVFIAAVGIAFGLWALV